MRESLITTEERYYKTTTDVRGGLSSWCDKEFDIFCDDDGAAVYAIFWYRFEISL